MFNSCTLHTHHSLQPAPCKFRVVNNVAHSVLGARMGQRGDSAWSMLWKFLIKKGKRLCKRITKLWKMTYRYRMTDIHGSILIITVLLQIICLILIAIVSSSPSFTLSFSVSHLSFGCLLPTQLLVQALVIYSFDHWKAHEVGLPLCAVKVLQMAHNAAGHLVFNQPKRPHVTLLLINLLWLSMTAPNQIQVTNAAFRVTSRSAPIYLNWNVKKPYVPQPLGSCCLVMPSLHTKRSQSRLLRSGVHQQWSNKLPKSIRAAASPSILVKTRLKC